MKLITYLENEALRIGIDIPEQSECNCNSDSEHYEVPIMVVGDSSEPIPWNLIKGLIYEHSRLHYRFIIDLLLVNGTCNRYMEARIQPNGKLDVKSISESSEVHEIIHQRATGLQYRLSKNLGVNVLTAAQQFAVSNGVAIAQRKHDE